jgi:hypothetical protein
MFHGDGTRPRQMITRSGGSIRGVLFIRSLSSSQPAILSMGSPSLTNRRSEPCLAYFSINRNVSAQMQQAVDRPTVRSFASEFRSRIRPTSSETDKHFAKFSGEAKVHVTYQDGGGRRTRMAVDEIAKVGSPFRHNQRSVRVKWVAMIIWQLKVLNSPAVLTHCTHQRFFQPVPGYREDVSASACERSCKFRESSCRIQDVLEKRPR